MRNSATGAAKNEGRFMKGQTATNSPWKRRCKLQWKRTNKNANSQFIPYNGSSTLTSKSTATKCRRWQNVSVDDFSVLATKSRRWHKIDCATFCWRRLRRHCGRDLSSQESKVVASCTYDKAKIHYTSFPVVST